IGGRGTPRPALNSGQTGMNSDFDACDIVEEIRRRVDDSGIARKMITIEITESIIGSDFEFMKSQIERFQSLGFPVWMDDFGSGYSSLDVLQTIRFDLLKFDMSFTKRLSTSDNAKIILSEMMKMAIALGVDTICEGVETAEHVQFLREIGCSKLQGYYYCRPVPVEYMFKLSAGRQSLGFENPAEAGYYEAIGRVNLFDLSMMASESNDALQKAFDTLPMGILEFTGDNMRFLRSSPTFRTFMKRYLDCDLIDHAHCKHPNGCVLTTHIKQCCAEGSRGFFADHLPDGSLFRVFVRKISVNPVTDATAAAVAVLSISELSEGADYASIAQALAADYYNIYYVNLEDDRFIEYRSTAGNTELAMERRGEHFFDSCQVEAQRRVYSEDLPTFLAAISKENVIRVLNQQGMFTTTYRLMDSGAPMYVSMKIMRMQSDDRHIIIGVSSVDAQMKEKAYQEELQKDRATLARIMVLSEDYLSLYIVTPDTDRYVEYNASNEYKTLGVAETGEAFFDTSIENGRRVVMPDDLPLYLEKFTKENILREIRENGMFHMEYRIIINDVPEPISLRIAPIHESDGDKLVVGLRLLRERHEVHPW
ncbi:MAG: EAL domain-containing protein, partial [bacterium]